MSGPFFPGVVFGWFFIAVLAVLLALAAVIDWRRMIVPKWLTLTALPLGLLFNLVRGAALGAQGQSVWLFDGHSLWVGLVDGLLFSLAGFVAGFSIFFLLWLLRICGGGDVKLYAAIGAWIGSYRAFLVLFVLLFVMVGIIFAQLVGRLLRGRSPVPVLPQHRPARLPTGLLPGNRPRRLLTFSLPLFLTTLLVLLWSFRADLHLVSRPVVTTVQVDRHAN
jgi:Flp pilus assembly protein protease CpaA